MDSETLKDLVIFYFLKSKNLNIFVGGMKTIQSHSFNLAKKAFLFLTKSKHANGSPIAKVYGWETVSKKSQGPIVTFNLKRDDGSFVGYVEASQL